jgi:hypothetical protein
MKKIQVAGSEVKNARSSQRVRGRHPGESRGPEHL